MTDREEIAKEHNMSLEFVNWFFDTKKHGCGNAWFVMMAAMWESWKHLAEQRDQLAAENAALKESRGVLAMNSLESCNEIYCAGYRNTALHDGLMESTGNRNKYPNPIRALVDEAKRSLETPATDAWQREKMAKGVESAGEYLKQYAQGLHEEARLVLQDAGELCNGYADQLRNGEAL